MAFRTIHIESACRLSYKSGYMVIRKDIDTTKIHLSEISTVMLQTMQVYISAYLMAELAENKISLVISDDGYNPVGQYLPLYGAHNVAFRTVEQLAWGESIKKRVWQRVVREKIHQQAALLEDREVPEAKMLKTMVDEVRSGDTTGREAHAARVYFKALFGDDFSRELDCPTNDALNYGYAVLLSAVNRCVVAKGYLTQYGINHRNEYNQFNLSCDLMEPFRPIVDRTVDDWVGGEFGVNERRMLSDLLNKKVSYKSGSYRLSSVISQFVQDCLNALNKKASIDDITGFEVE